MFIIKLELTDLLEIIKEYNPEEVEVIKKAYYFAEELHKGQVRQSGEPYISHPLNVAYILAEMHADRDTVCAGLLHDTLEDTETTNIFQRCIIIISQKMKMIIRMK